jgi:hypothetical protein
MTMYIDTTPKEHRIRDKRPRIKAKVRQQAKAKLRCRDCDKPIRICGGRGPLPTRCAGCTKRRRLKLNASSLLTRRKKKLNR